MTYDIMFFSGNPLTSGRIINHMIVHATSAENALEIFNFTIVPKYLNHPYFYEMTTINRVTLL
jgi:hypothetical protein